MKALHKSGLPGKYKAWGYQHGVLPRLLWPLLVYEFSYLHGGKAREEDKLETLRRWLGVPKCFCSIRLYSSGGKLQMAVTSVVEYKARKMRQATMLSDNRDERSRSASRALREVEDRLQHANIVGAGMYHQGKLEESQSDGAWCKRKSTRQRRRVNKSRLWP